MLKSELWFSSVSQAELDQRARDARRRLEQLERLLMPFVAAKPARRGRLPRLPGLDFYRRGFGRSQHSRRTRRPLSDRRPSAISEIHQNRRLAGWFCRA